MRGSAVITEIQRVAAISTRVTRRSIRTMKSATNWNSRKPLIYVGLAVPDQRANFQKLWPAVHHAPFPERSQADTELFGNLSFREKCLGDVRLWHESSFGSPLTHDGFAQTSSGEVFEPPRITGSVL